MSFAFKTNQGSCVRRELGKNSLRAYGCLALRFSQGNKQQFHIRPKLRMLQHVVLALEPLSSSAFAPNPWAETVWGDEDYVGRISRSSRRTHPLTTAAATIGRYQLLVLHHLRQRAQTV